MSTDKLTISNKPLWLWNTFISNLSPIFLILLFASLATVTFLSSPYALANFKSTSLPITNFIIFILKTGFILLLGICCIQIITIMLEGIAENKKKSSTIFDMISLALIGLGCWFAIPDASIGLWVTKIMAVNAASTHIPWAAAFCFAVGFGIKSIKHVKLMNHNRTILYTLTCVTIVTSLMIPPLLKTDNVVKIIATIMLAIGCMNALIYQIISIKQKASS